MGNKKYSAIIFDVGDTLVRWYPNWAEIYTGRLRKIGLNVDDSLSECISNSIYNADYQLIQKEQESGLCLDTNEVDSLLDKAALKCLPTLPKPIDELVQEMKNIPKVKQEMHVISGVHGMFQTLKKSGYRLAIVSNHHSWLNSFLKENNLFDFFDTVVISEDVGVKKPNTKIMEIALERLHLTTDNCLYVGDQLLDVLCAKKAGLDMALIVSDDQNKHSDKIGYKEDYRISSVLDIIKLLE